MTELLTNPAILALIGTIFGGVGLKVIEHWLSKAKTRDDTATQIRNELRTELARVKEDMTKREQYASAAEAEADGWRAKYYEQAEKLIQIKLDLASAQNEVNAIKRKNAKE